MADQTRPSNTGTKRATARRGRVSHGLVALGSAPFLAVYSAGYVRTRAAAERIAEHDARRGTVPAPATAPPVALTHTEASRVEAPASEAPPIPAKSRRSARRPSSNASPSLPSIGIAETTTPT